MFGQENLRKMEANDLLNKMLKSPEKIGEMMKQAKESASKQIAQVKDPKQREILEEALSIAGGGNIDEVKQLLIKLND